MSSHCNYVLIFKSTLWKIKRGDERKNKKKNRGHMSLRKISQHLVSPHGAHGYRWLSGVWVL